MSEVEAFGSASVNGYGPHSFHPMFSDAGSLANGSPSMLLGHDKGYDYRGAAFEVGPAGIHKGHALTFGRTRGGKGVSAIIPALLTYSGSMVVIDPKGENAWITAQRRRDMGQRVVILDPWGEVNRRYGAKVGVTENVTKFNPLSAPHPDDPDFSDDVSAIAEAFILQTGTDPHWSDSARELTGGLIAAEVQRSPGTASMHSVRKLLRAPLDLLQAAVELVLMEFPDSVAAGKLAAIAERNEDGKTVSTNEMSSIRSTARTQTAFLDSVRLTDSMQTDDEPFDLQELATGKVTLYLVLPVDRLKSHGRWLRMILTLAIRAISKASELPAVPVVFLLDELGTISPGSGLSMVEQSYGLMAGLGIRIWAFMQDLPQLKRDYPASWETFIANSSVIQLLNVADNTTAKYFSEYLGNGTVNARTGSWTFKSKQYEGNDSYTNRLNTRLAERLVEEGICKPEHAYAYADAVSMVKTPYWNADKTNVYLKSVQNGLEKLGVTWNGYSEWTADTQPVSRPVFFPWEIVNLAPESCIVIMPGLANYHLGRFAYFTNPFLAKWARQDPNKPPMNPRSMPVVKAPVFWQSPSQAPPPRP